MLAAGGAEVLAWDDNEKTRAAAGDEMPLCDPARIAWRDVAALVLSPGIAHSVPEPHLAVVAARAARVEIIGDIELLGRAQPEARYIGITGTNGKSTTTALLGHILQSAGKQVEIGGNPGPPALGLAPLGADGIYVLEMSSFQLELMNSLAFDIAVLLNITPDHLDRHGDMTGYIAAKKRIFAGHNGKAVAIVGVDDPICRDIFEELATTDESRVIPISVAGEAPGGVWIKDGWLIEGMKESPAGIANGSPTRVLDLAEERCCRACMDSAEHRSCLRRGALRGALQRARRCRDPHLSWDWRTVKSWWIQSTAYAISTIRRPPTPTRPKRRSRATKRSTGSPGAFQRQEGSRRWRLISSACGMPS